MESSGGKKGKKGKGKKKKGPRRVEHVEDIELEGNVPQEEFPKVEVARRLPSSVESINETISSLPQDTQGDKSKFKVRETISLVPDELAPAEEASPSKPDVAQDVAQVVEKNELEGSVRQEGYPLRQRGRKKVERGKVREINRIIPDPSVQDAVQPVTQVFEQNELEGNVRQEEHPPLKVKKNAGRGNLRSTIRVIPNEPAPASPLVQDVAQDVTKDMAQVVMQDAKEDVTPDDMKDGMPDDTQDTPIEVVVHDTPSKSPKIDEKLEETIIEIEGDQLEDDGNNTTKKRLHYSSTGNREAEDKNFDEAPDGIDAESMENGAEDRHVVPMDMDGMEERTESPVKATTPVIMQYEDTDFGSIDPKQYGLEFESDEDFNYEPPNKDLPDLNQLMGTLDGGESDLETETEPPSLFKRPEHEPNYKRIYDLRLMMEEEGIDPYIKEFEDNVHDDVLMIGNISLEEVQEEERRLRDEHILYQQQEASLAKKRQEEILLREEHAKKHVMTVMKERRKEIARREELGLQKERLQHDQLHKTFKKAESQLQRALEIRKGEVKTMYGDLMLADGQYGGSKGRRWKVDWTKTPQPVQLKLKCLRGVKDKLPGGRYVLMTSMYNRMGGHVQRWSSLRGQEWSGATLPLNHEGHFSDVEIKIDQSVFTVCPSKPNIRPGMVFVFELFLLRGSLLPVDKVVAWGLFPICDAQFNVVEGRYKTPMLRGEMDPKIERHETVEKLIASDLDHWLCNLYFEVVKLPRYLAGQKEYEIELQFTSKMLSYPDRVKAAEEAVDGEEPIAGSAVEMASEAGSEHFKGSTNSVELAAEASEEMPSTSLDAVSKGKQELTSSNDTLNFKDSQDSIFKSVKSDDDTGSLRYRGTKHDLPSTATVIGSRRLMKKIGKPGLDSSDSESDDEDVKERVDGFTQVRGEPGLYYKKHSHPPATEYMNKLYTMLPKTALLNPAKRKKKLTYLEQLETHSFAVLRPFSTKGHIHHHSQEKVQYVFRQLLSELGLSQWRSRDFWVLLLMFCLIYFIRVFLHYIGQWAFLQIINIPINRFDYVAYTIYLNYQSSLLYTQEEIAVVLLGPMTNILVFVLFLLFCWVFQKIIGSFPSIFSKFVLVFGIQAAILDVIFIAIIDAALQRYKYVGGDEPIADMAKLYHHFDRTQGSGTMGIILTVILYVFVIFLACVIFYMYFLRLHNNGRMLDVYHRLHATNDNFFTPYDLELSNQELAYICKKAEQWRGEEGERRKVAVYDYIWEEEQAEENMWGDKREVTNEKPFKEITSHISIHSLHLDGLRELHRHFLRLPDGAIVEVFGEMGVVGMDKDMKTALLRGTQGMTQMMGSTTSLKRPVRPKTTGGLGSQDFANLPPATAIGQRPMSGRQQQDRTLPTGETHSVSGARPMSGVRPRSSSRPMTATRPTSGSRPKSGSRPSSRNRPKSASRPASGNRAPVLVDNTTTNDSAV